MSDASWAWPVVLLLGAWHGINPGMGWLFAVALGLQERRGRAVWRALPPLALGHGLAVLAAIAVAAAVGLVVPAAVLKWAVAATLLGFGIWKLRGGRHPRYGGMRVGAKGLTLWSALMATAHGGGLMLLPVVVGATGSGPGAVEHAHAHGHAAHGAALAAGVPDATAALAIAVLHTAAYLLATGLVAVIVYEKVGLRMLRSAWLNLDRIWAGALIVTGLLTPLL
jgi:hypothetical protein